MEGALDDTWPDFDAHRPQIHLLKTSWDDLGSELTQARELYTLLVEQFTQPPKDVDPLSLDTGNPWNVYFNDAPLRQEIQQDVARTNPEQDFFRQGQVQDNLTRCLFIYAKVNPDLAYRQGMHELAATLYFVIQADSVKATAPGSWDPLAARTGETVLEWVCGEDYVEHDTFTLFIRLMETCKPWYEFESTKSTTLPVIQRGLDIQTRRLGQVDPQLARHLSVIGLSPQFYLLRWLRCLFGREFEFDQVLKVWDALLTTKHGLDLVDWVAVAMLVRIREELLSSDSSSALVHVMRYPAPSDNQLESLLSQAVQFADRPRPLQIAQKIPSPAEAGPRSRKTRQGESTSVSAGWSQFAESATQAALAKSEEMGIPSLVSAGLSHLRRMGDDLRTRPPIDSRHDFPARSLDRYVSSTPFVGEATYPPPLRPRSTSAWIAREREMAAVLGQILEAEPNLSAESRSRLGHLQSVCLGQSEWIERDERTAPSDRALKAPQPTTAEPMVETKSEGKLRPSVAFRPLQEASDPLGAQ